METHPLHQKALDLVKEFKRVEAELIEVLEKIDSSKRLYHGFKKS